MQKCASLVKKVLLAAGAAIGFLALIGYVTAKLTQDEIEKEISAFVQSKGIAGRSFGGKKVPPEVSSSVEWPFVVVGSYVVPFDLHASYHRTTYLCLPWGKCVLGKEDVFSV